MMATCRIFLAAVLLITVVLPSDAARQLDEHNSGPFGMPWFGGYGFPGWAGPYGPYGWRDFAHPTMVCKEEGSCFNKKLTCPANCYHSWGDKNNDGASGGTGGCYFDCKKCFASC